MSQGVSLRRVFQYGLMQLVLKVQVSFSPLDRVSVISTHWVTGIMRHT